MKDPLQKQQTPYEILGVGRDATAADIDKAFKLGLVKRVPVQKLTGAKVALERPVERALLDALHYDDAVLARLGPFDLTDRMAAEKSWESQLRRAFPDAGIIHALAVLWYWEAISISERCAENPSRKYNAAAAECWRNAICFWAALIASDDYWPSPAIATAVHDRIAADVHRFTQLGDNLTKIELMFRNEVRVAKALAAADIRANRGRLACGPIMLERMELVDKIRTQINNALQINPGNASLIQVRDALSPFSAIAALIESKQYKEALDEIERLPSTARDAREVWTLETQALFERGRQQASLGELEAALGLWAKALTKATSEDAKKQVHDELVATVQKKAAALQGQQPDEAIRILDRALKVVRSQKLELTLAEILTNRGIATILEAQKKEKGADAIKAIEKGLADLERAAKLGSKRAEEQAAIAKNIVAGLKGGIVAADVPSAVQSLLNQAAKAAERKEWTTAIDLLRRALNETGYQSEAARTIKKHLATMLANRAIGAVNAIMTMMQEKASKTPADLQMFVTVLDTAHKDLREASQLDPSSDYVRDNLREVEQMLDNLGPAARMAVPFSPFDDLPDLSPVSTKSNERRTAHGLIVGAMVVLAMVLALSTQKAAYETKVSTWLTAEVLALRDGSVPGAISYYMAKVIGWPAWLVTFIMFFGSWFAVPGAYLYGVVCGTAWWKKDGFAKLVEITLYVFVLLFLSAVAVRIGGRASRPPATGVPPVAKAVAPAKAPAKAVVKAPMTAGRMPAVGGRDARPPGDVLSTLQSIAKAPAAEAKKQAGVFESAGAAKASAMFLAGAAYERGGDLEKARAAYQRVVTMDTASFKRSAEFRLAALDPQAEEKFRSLAGQKGSDGLFYLGGAWTSSNTQRAALQGLMDLRAGWKSVRLFNFLRGKSFFPPPYAYLFILLMLAVAIKVLSLPFLVHGAKVSLAIPRLRGEYQRLKARHAGDAVAFSSAITAMYKRNGINPSAGCAKIAIDIGFVVWVMVALKNYAPQLTLDGSRFFWLSNVTQRDAGVLVMWGLAGLVMLFLTPQIEEGQKRQLACASAAMLGIIAAAAWYWSWPAYLMIFWTVLSLFTAVVHFVTIGVLATRS